MKKYLTIALAMPLLFACSSEDLTEKEVIGNNQFAGIETVDATFSMDEESVTRMATQWDFEEGDRYGFAWLTDQYDKLGTTPKVSINGNAFQNHPLTQKGSNFVPETSIYVGKYFLYRPYDESVVSPDNIHFSLANQALANDASEKHNSDPYKALAATAILIGDKWTDVDPAGHTVGTTKWDEPGIGKRYDLYAALFSNRTALDLTYKNNNPKFASETTISGATDINFKIAKDEEVGAVDISKITVDLQRSGSSASATTFTYGPNKLDMEPVKVAKVVDEKHDGKFWESKSNVAADYGFSFTDGAITLENADKSKINTGTEGSKGWFWFNSLPVTTGDAALDDKVVTTYETTFGTVTINDKDGANTEVTLQNVAFARELPTSSAATKEWIKFGSSDDLDKAKDEKVWNIAAAKHNSFVNQYGNHAGKYAITVDFSKCVMDGMHITDDHHLQQALRYYIASGKTEDVSLKLDKDADGNFKLSKISIALIQTIGAEGHKVRIGACDDAAHKPSKIIITQDGQEALGLGNATEVPALDGVFKVATNVYLAAKNSDGSAIAWTWGGGTDGKTKLPSSSLVKSIINEGTLTVNATNVQVAGSTTLENAAGATMNITKVTTVKNALTNLGTIEVGDATNTTAELRAYGVEIKNDATSLTAKGVINNYGVVGVSAGTSGKFNNYGLIDMKQNEAITLLTSNEIASGTNAFEANFAKGTNMMGTVKLPSNNPTAIVSVSNTDENGFIEYDWTGATYATPAGIVKYNTIVVSNNIAFTADAPEIQYIKFDGTRTQVVNPGLPGTDGHLTAPLKGIIVNAGKSIIIEKSNTINCNVGAYLGSGATVYKGGAFTYPVDQETDNYFSITGSTWTTDQIVEY